MSAYMVDSEEIAAIIGTYVAMAVNDVHYQRQVEGDAPLNAARMLHRQNLRSTDDRYTQTGNAEAVAEFTAAYVADPVTARQIRRWQLQPLTPAQLFAVLDHFEYQACETDDWKTTEAKELCDFIRRIACKKVPGYDAVAWGSLTNAPPVRLTS